MNSKEFEHFDKSKKNIFESLKKEYDFIQSNIYTIKNMKISEEAKKLPLQELETQKNKVKEKMHNYIDTL